MTPAPISEIGLDHKHWLADIERWDDFGQAWKKEIHELTREYRRILKMVEQHADEVEEFCESVESHRKRIVADERAALEHRPPADETALSTSHAENAARHDELYKAQERLKQIQHTLMLGLALLKHEPYHGE